MHKKDGIKDEVKDAIEAFSVVQEAEEDNRQAALADLKFARLGEQWPEQIKNQREMERRPCLTINRLPAFIRQVVNDARQNKQQMTVHPADSMADKETAKIIQGLLYSTQQSSKADIAYDTAIEFAVSMGFGYFRVDVDYSHDDTFDLDIMIKPVRNPFSVYGDPH
ncbi:MAG: portal protein, partial [Burkholderiales bacterium]